MGTRPSRHPLTPSPTPLTRGSLRRRTQSVVRGRVARREAGARRRAVTALQRLARVRCAKLAAEREKARKAEAQAAFATAFRVRHSHVLVACVPFSHLFSFGHKD
jgi:hypothetical protein